MIRRQRTNNVVNVLLVGILLVTFTPVLPLAFLLVFAFYMLKLKTEKAFYISIYIALAGCCFSLFVYQKFLVEQLKSVMQSIFTITNIDIFRFLDFSRYTALNWIFMFSISIIFALYLSTIMSENRQKQIAGLTGFKKEVDRISKIKEHFSQPSKGVLIGQENKKDIISNFSHCCVAGTTGSGKTVLIANYIDYCSVNSLPALIVDGKGDITGGSLLYAVKNACKKYNKKLYIVDMNNVHNSAKYNPFLGANATAIKDMLINLTDWTEPHYKYNVERYLQKLITLILLKHETLDFKLIIEYMGQEKFKELLTELVKQEKITKQEKIDIDELIKESIRTVSGAIARFSIIESEMSTIFDIDGIDIYSALKENAVIVFVLNPLLYPETASALGRLAIIDAKKAVSKLFIEEKKRTFFIFDEVNVYVSTSLLNILNKSRSADITCVLAMQSLSDLDVISESFKNQIIENCNNFIFMRENSFKSAEEISKIIGTMETMKMTYKIDNDMNGSGQGSARRVREFIVHPDEVKSLRQGEAIYLFKDSNRSGKCLVNLPEIIK